VDSTIRRSWTTARLVFSVMLLLCAGFVLPAAAQSISGTVFEDHGYTGGAGRNFATAGGGVTGARVELYQANVFYAFTTTSATGAYSFAGLPNTTYTYVVRVVNSTVVSTYTGGGTAGLVPVQTYRTDCSAGGGCTNGNTVNGTHGPVADHVGGENPATLDPGANSSGGVPSGAQSITTVNIVKNGNRTPVGIDFGFNFFTIVNTNPSLANPSLQGSLAQFITNVNALTGASNVNAIFMISDGNAHPGLTALYPSTQLTGTANGNVFRITAGSMPAVTAANVTIDATNEITNLGTNPNTGTYGPVGITLGSGPLASTLLQWAGPSVEIMSNAGDQQWLLSGASDQVIGFAFAQFTLYLSGNGASAKENFVGMHADETFTGPIIPAETAYYGIQLGAGSNITIHHNLVAVNNSGIRHENVSPTGDVIEYNDVDLPSGAQTTTYDGILMVGPGTFSNETIQYNYVHNQRGGGIEVGFSGSPNTVLSNEQIQYNTVQYNGWVLNGTGPKGPAYTYITPSTEPINIAVWGVTSGSTAFITNNLVSNSGGVGVLIENAYGFKISQNSIYQNGYSPNYRASQGPGISLYNSNVDPNVFGTSLGITPNTGTLDPTKPNNFMNYPVITLTTYSGGKLRVKGYVGASTNLAVANATVELFLANNTDTNQNGEIFKGDGLSVAHGEGQNYVCSFPADATGNFDVQLPSASIPGCSAFSSGVTITAGSTVLTSTATDAGTASTSEFGPNATVLANAVTISGYVYLDADHDGNLDLGESWQNGTQIYVSLWNGAAQVGTTQIVPAGSANDTGFYSFDNLPNASGATYTIVLSTIANPTGTVSAGIPAGYLSVNPGTATIVVTFTSSASTTMNHNFGLFHGLKVSGKLFKDNGVGTGGAANDGHLNGTEPGLPNVNLAAKDSGSVLLGQTTTDGGGNYTLWLPTTAVNPVTITLTQVGNYTATGFDAGVPATSGTYNTTTFVFSFTANWANPAYTGVNFGFIQSGNIFAPNGQQMTVPGSFAIYSHQYTSITGGSVTFAEAAAQSQPNYFNEILYNDTTCTGNLASATYLPWGTAVPLPAIPAGGISAKVCLLMKETVGLAASYGMQNAVTITATFSYGPGSSVASTTLTVVDLTIIETRSSGDLQLVKSSYIDASCANLNIVSNPVFLTTTQSAQSGFCIQYQMQATNGGASALSGLTINDTAPPYTTLQSGTHSPASSVGLGSSCTGLAAGPITVTGSAVQATFTGTMPAGCVATFVYEVKLN
jgi:hypothetical protein